MGKLRWKRYKISEETHPAGHVYAPGIGIVLQELIECPAAKEAGYFNYTGWEDVPIVIEGD